MDSAFYKTEMKIWAGKKFGQHILYGENEISVRGGESWGGEEMLGV